MNAAYTTVAVSFFVLACSSCSPAAPSPSVASSAPSAVASASPPPARVATPDLEGDLVVPAGSSPRGRLVLGWRTAAEQAELASGKFSLSVVRRTLERLEVRGDVDFSGKPRIHYRIEGAPEGAVPTAILDVDQTFFETFLGRGKGLTGTGTGVKGGGDIALAPNPPPSTAERCSGPRFKLIEVEGSGLSPAAGTRAGPLPAWTKRRFCAWLPASWSEKSQRRYPLVLLFPGFMSNDTAYLSGNEHLGTRLDAITAETKREAVLVGVDTSTTLGSTYLEDGAVQGGFATFLVTRALPALEKELRTIPSRTARAVLGHSTGGYNALSYGLRRADTFSVIGASSPDAPDVEAWLFEPGTRRAREWIRNWTRLEDGVGGAGQMTSYAADWSPPMTAGAKTRWRWPFDLATGVADEEVVARWVEKSPHGFLRDPSFVAKSHALLSGRIYVSVGRDDEFGLFAPAQRFAGELDAAGIATRFVPTDGGHGNNQERLEAALRFALERLDHSASSKM